MLIRSTWRERTGRLPDRLAAEIRDAIQRGSIPPGSPLPAERAVAAQAGVSRSTVVAAFNLLDGSGWIRRRARARAVAAFPDSHRQTLAPAPLDPAGALDVRRALVAAPSGELTRALEQARTALVPHLLTDGRLDAGIPALRERVAARYTAGGLPTEARQIVITNGALGAFAAIVDSTPGRVLIEDPTYYVALRMLAARRRPLIAWTRGPCWDVDHLTALVRRQRPSLAYLVPDFHNPTGRLASADERSTVAAAMPSGCTVVVDETLREIDLRERGTPLPGHLASFLPSAFTVGSLSKTVWSGLRIGWLRAPDVATAERIVLSTNAHPVPVIEQLVAAELLSVLDTITAARLPRLAAQRDLTLELVAERGMSAHVPDGGLVLWVDIGRPLASVIAAALATRGMHVLPGAASAARGVFERHLRLPIVHPPDVLARVLDAVVDELGDRRRRPGRR